VHYLPWKAPFSLRQPAESERRLSALDLLSSMSQAHLLRFRSGAPTDTGDLAPELPRPGMLAIAQANGHLLCSRAAALMTTGDLAAALPRPGIPGRISSAPDIRRASSASPSGGRPPLSVERTEDDWRSCARPSASGRPGRTNRHRRSSGLATNVRLRLAGAGCIRFRLLARLRLTVASGGAWRAKYDRRSRARKNQMLGFHSLALTDTGNVARSLPPRGASGDAWANTRRREARLVQARGLLVRKLGSSRRFGGPRNERRASSMLSERGRRCGYRDERGLLGPQGAVEILMTLQGRSAGGDVWRQAGACR